MEFREFVREQIQYYVHHFQKKRVLLELNGDLRNMIDLSFDHLSDLYLNYLEEQPQANAQTTLPSTAPLSAAHIKITDNDLLLLWEHIDRSYRLALNLEGQDVSDETLLKLSELYLTGRCAFTKLRLAGNARISEVGVGKLGQSLQGFPEIEEISLHGLEVAGGGIKYFWN